MSISWNQNIDSTQSIRGLPSTLPQENARANSSTKAQKTVLDTNPTLNSAASQGISSKGIAQVFGKNGATVSPTKSIIKNLHSASGNASEVKPGVTGKGQPITALDIQARNNVKTQFMKDTGHSAAEFNELIKDNNKTILKLVDAEKQKLSPPKLEIKQDKLEPEVPKSDKSNVENKEKIVSEKPGQAEIKKDDKLEEKESLMEKFRASKDFDAKKEIIKSFNEITASQDAPSDKYTSDCNKEFAVRLLGDVLGKTGEIITLKSEILELEKAKLGADEPQRKLLDEQIGDKLDTLDDCEIALSNITKRINKNCDAIDDAEVDFKQEVNVAIDKAETSKSNTDFTEFRNSRDFTKFDEIKEQMEGLMGAFKKLSWSDKKEFVENVEGYKDNQFERLDRLGAGGADLKVVNEMRNQVKNYVAECNLEIAGSFLNSAANRKNELKEMKQEATENQKLLQELKSKGKTEEADQLSKKMAENDITMKRKEKGMSISSNIAKECLEAIDKSHVDPLIKELTTTTGFCQDKHKAFLELKPYIESRNNLFQKFEVGGAEEFRDKISIINKKYIEDAARESGMFLQNVAKAITMLPAKKEHLRNAQDLDSQIKFASAIEIDETNIKKWESLFAEDIQMVNEGLNFIKGESRKLRDTESNNEFIKNENAFIAKNETRLNELQLSFGDPLLTGAVFKKYFTSEVQLAGDLSSSLVRGLGQTNPLEEDNVPPPEKINEIISLMGDFSLRAPLPKEKLDNLEGIIREYATVVTEYMEGKKVLSSNSEERDQNFQTSSQGIMDRLKSIELQGSDEIKWETFRKLLGGRMLSANFYVDLSKDGSSLNSLESELRKGPTNARLVEIKKSLDGKEAILKGLDNQGPSRALILGGGETISRLRRIVQKLETL